MSPFVTWAMSQPQWFQIVVLLALTISAIAATGCMVYLFYIVIRKGFTLRQGSNVFTLGAGIQDQNVSPHVNCPHNKDVVILIAEVTKLINKQVVLNLHQTVREQMTYAEQKSHSIKALLQGIYLDLLKEKVSGKIVSSYSYANYRLILREMIDELLSDLRNDLRQNHLLEMDESSFSRFVDDKVESYSVRGTEILNQSYFYTEEVTREELYTANQRVATKIKSTMGDILFNARKISIRAREESNAIDTEMNGLLEKFISKPSG